MSKPKLIFLLFFILTATIFSPPISLADDLQKIAVDLQPVDGHIVMPFEGKYIIDLDASHGLHAGDLFAVIVPGKKIVHPISKEVIGSLNKVKAVLRATLIQSGFSYAERLYGKEEISKGEAIRRFSKLTAAFYSTSQASEEIYQRLQNLLPELDWQGHFRTQPTSPQEGEYNLSFALSGPELKVIDQRGQQLQTYTVAVDQTSEKERLQTKVQDNLVPLTAQKMPVATTPRQLVVQATSPAKNLEWQSPGINFDDLNRLGELPFRTLMASFNKVGENLFVATVDGSRVVYPGCRHHLSANMPSAGEASVLDGAADPIMVSWWQPRLDGPTYLAVTASLEIERDFGKTTETKLSGAIFQWHNNTLTPVTTRVPYFLFSYDLNGDINS